MLPEPTVRADAVDLPLVVADVLGGWVVLAEHNGYHGPMPEVLCRLSAGIGRRRRIGRP